MVLGKIFGGDTVKAVGNVIDDMHFSGEEKEKLKLQFAEVEAKLKEKQMAINLADSQSTAGGISGFLQRAWRPLIGMSCALAIFWEFVLSKFICNAYFWLLRFIFSSFYLCRLNLISLTKILGK